MEHNILMTVKNQESIPVESKLHLSEVSILWFWSSYLFVQDSHINLDIFTLRRSTTSQIVRWSPKYLKPKYFLVRDSNVWLMAHIYFPPLLDFQSVPGWLCLINTNYFLKFWCPYSPSCKSSPRKYFSFRSSSSGLIHQCKNLWLIKIDHNTQRWHCDRSLNIFSSEKINHGASHHVARKWGVQSYSCWQTIKESKTLLQKWVSHLFSRLGQLLFKDTDEGKSDIAWLS